MEINFKDVIDGFIRGATLKDADDLESSFLEELLLGYETNGKEARRAMRKLMAHDNVKFFCSACRILKTGANTAGHEYLTKLLLEGDLLLASLADPALFSLDTAIDLARVFVRVDPLLDFKLMQLLFQGEQAEGVEIDTAKARHMLEIVAALPAHTRILPLLLKLIRVPDQRLRSKAILLFCLASRNPQWAERRMADDESRIRASAVEGLWGVNSPPARALMHEASRDIDHRVVANALVGLYMLDGMEAVAQSVETMAASPAPPFRAAAAFAMGQIGESQLVPLLSQMMKDPNPQVRSSVLRALVRIRKAERLPAAGHPKSVVQAPAVPSADGSPVNGTAERAASTADPEKELVQPPAVVQPEELAAPADPSTTSEAPPQPDGK